MNQEVGSRFTQMPHDWQAPRDSSEAGCKTVRPTPCEKPWPGMTLDPPDNGWYLATFLVLFRCSEQVRGTEASTLTIQLDRYQIIRVASTFASFIPTIFMLDTLRTTSFAICSGLELCLTTYPLAWFLKGSTNYDYSKTGCLSVF